MRAYASMYRPFRPTAISGHTRLTSGDTRLISGHKKAKTSHAINPSHIWFVYQSSPIIRSDFVQEMHPFKLDPEQDTSCYLTAHMRDCTLNHPKEIEGGLPRMTD